MARGQLRTSGDESGDPEPEDAVAEALAAFGLFSEESVVVEDEFLLWPENARTFNLWLRVQTQWNSDTGQRVGLNYASIWAFLDRAVKCKKDRAEIFAGFQVMESAALVEWSEKK